MVHCAVDHFGALLRTIPCIQCTIPSTQHTIPKGAISPNSTYNLIRLIALMWGLPEVTTVKGKGPERDPSKQDPKRACTMISYVDISLPMGDADIPMYIEEGYPLLPPAGVDQQDASALLRASA